MNVFLPAIIALPLSLLALLNPASASEQARAFCNDYGNEAGILAHLHQTGMSDDALLSIGGLNDSILEADGPLPDSLSRPASRLAKEVISTPIDKEPDGEVVNVIGFTVSATVECMQEMNGQ